MDRHEVEKGSVVDAKTRETAETLLEVLRKRQRKETLVARSDIHTATKERVPESLISVGAGVLVPAVPAPAAQHPAAAKTIRHGFELDATGWGNANNSGNSHRGCGSSPPRIQSRRETQAQYKLPQQPHQEQHQEKHQQQIHPVPNNRQPQNMDPLKATIDTSTGSVFNANGNSYRTASPAPVATGFHDQMAFSMTSIGIGIDHQHYHFQNQSRGNPPPFPDATEAAAKAVKDAMDRSFLRCSYHPSSTAPLQIRIRLGVPCAQSSGTHKTNVGTLMAVDQKRIASVLPSSVNLLPLQLEVGGLFVPGGSGGNNSNPSANRTAPSICTVVACITLEPFDRCRQPLPSSTQQLSSPPQRQSTQLVPNQPKVSIFSSTSTLRGTATTTAAPLPPPPLSYRTTQQGEHHSAEREPTDGNRTDLRPSAIGESKIHQCEATIEGKKSQQHQSLARGNSTKRAHANALPPPSQPHRQIAAVSAATTNSIELLAMISAQEINRTNTTTIASSATQVAAAAATAVPPSHTHPTPDLRVPPMAPEGTDTSTDHHISGKRKPFPPERTTPKNHGKNSEVLNGGIQASFNGGPQPSANNGARTVPGTSSAPLSDARIQTCGSVAIQRPPPSSPIYTDWSDERPLPEERDCWALSTRTTSSPVFPLKLHETLSQIERDGLEHIIGWLPHGRSFKIFKQKEFAEIILPRYFVMTKKSSFLRQLNLYSFRRFSAGFTDKGSYYHEKFLRGRKFLTRRMTRQKVNGNRIRSAGNPDEEPNLMLYPVCYGENQSEEKQQQRQQHQRELPATLSSSQSSFCVYTAPGPTQTATDPPVAGGISNRNDTIGTAPFLKVL